MATDDGGASARSMTSQFLPIGEALGYAEGCRVHDRLAEAETISRHILDVQPDLVPDESRVSGNGVLRPVDARRTWGDDAAAYRIAASTRRLITIC